MSSALEPPTTAKVVLHTTKGPIEIELWAKETPKACRNFLQHCLDGYYDGTIFHRVVPDFLIQGGDPSGTGNGGRSIYPDGFPSEYHSRLRFNRRGLLGNADADQLNDNSQFFITLAATPELQNKNTLFGRIMGDTIFNVLKIAEAERDQDDRPLYPAKVTRAEILVNYFEDMKPRNQVRRREDKKDKKKVVKSRVKMSFAEDEDEGEDTPGFKMKPAHELLHDSRLVNNPTAYEETESRLKEKTDSKERREKEREKEKEEKEEKERGKDNEKEKEKNKEREKEKEEKEKKEMPSEFDRINAEIAAVKAAMKRPTEAGTKPKKEKKLSALEEQREKYVKRQPVLSKKRARELREADTVAKLKEFTARLHSASVANPPPLKIAQQEAGELCELHNLPNCQSCMYYDALSEGENEDPSTLWSHTFVDEKSQRKRPLRIPSPPPPPVPAKRRHR